MASVTDADSEKAKGTAAYARKDYEEAIACYTRALEIHNEEGRPMPKTLIHNRALSHLRSEDFKRALKDADATIACDSAWHKGYSTKAYALVGLGRTSAAVACLMKGQGLVGEGRSKLRALEKHFDGAGDASAGSAAPSGGGASASAAPRATPSGGGGSTWSYLTRSWAKTFGFLLCVAVLLSIAASFAVLPLGNMTMVSGFYRYALFATIARHSVEAWSDPALRPRQLSKEFAARLMLSPWTPPILFSMSSFFCKSIPAMLLSMLPLALHAGFGLAAWGAALETHRGGAPLIGRSLVARVAALVVVRLPDPAAPSAEAWSAMSADRQWARVSTVLPTSIAKIEITIGVVAVLTLLLPIRDIFHTLFFWQYLRMRYMVALTPQVRDKAVLGAFAWVHLKILGAAEHRFCPRFVGGAYVYASGKISAFAAPPKPGTKPSMCSVM